MDFTEDSLSTGRRFRTLNVVDAFTRECLLIEVDHSLPGPRVARLLEQLVERHGRPEVIRVSASTTGPSSRAASSTAGPSSEASSSTSSGRGSRWKTRTSKASTASSGTSA